MVKIVDKVVSMFRFSALNCNTTPASSQNTLPLTTSQSNIDGFVVKNYQQSKSTCAGLGPFEYPTEKFCFRFVSDSRTEIPKEIPLAKDWSITSWGLSRAKWLSYKIKLSLNTLTHGSHTTRCDVTRKSSFVLTAPCISSYHLWSHNPPFSRVDLCSLLAAGVVWTFTMVIKIICLFEFSKGNVFSP